MRTMILINEEIIKYTHTHTYIIGKNVEISIKPEVAWKLVKCGFAFSTILFGVTMIKVFELFSVDVLTVCLEAKPSPILTSISS